MSSPRTRLYYLQASGESFVSISLVTQTTSPCLKISVLNLSRLAAFTKGNLFWIILDSRSPFLNFLTTLCSAQGHGAILLACASDVLLQCKHAHMSQICIWEQTWAFPSAWGHLSLPTWSLRHTCPKKEPTIVVILRLYCAQAQRNRADQ